MTARQAGPTAVVGTTRNDVVKCDGSSFPPAFLFGFERSGTTLLSMMVGAHPEIAVPFSATGLWYRYGDQLEDYGGLGSAADLARLIDDLLAEERVRLWDATLDREAILAAARPGDYGSVVAAFHAEYARQKGKPCWANIDIATLERMDQANRWFPDARFVHIVRDGRDVALSHRTYAYGRATGADAAADWARDVRTNLRMGAMLPPARYHVLRYEDLVLDAEPTLRRLCDGLGVPFAPAMLDYARMADAKVPEDKRFLWPRLGQPLAKNNTYRWRGAMGRPSRIVIERIAGPLLRELGYETYAKPPWDPRAALLSLWWFVGQGGRLRRLARRLGFTARKR